jgi:unsaturated chondroitin disaccharide hydrolase
MKKWIEKEAIAQYPIITEEELKESMRCCVRQVRNNMPAFAEHFPAACSVNQFYTPGINTDWTSGFWTGEVWLSYENAENDEDRKLFLEAGNRQVDSFLHRIIVKHYVDHHDMGFLYSPSCVAAFKLTGNENAKKAALLAADQLIKRYRPVGEYIQAWGPYGAKDNSRFIIDCLLNIPLLYWASEESRNSTYRNIAEKHIHTTMKYIVREDNSTWYTVFLDPVTGEFSRGATCQGYMDNSAWARGQAWGIYGTAIAYKNTGRKEYIEYFRRVADYYLSHLPSDLCPYWDLSFGDGDEKEQERDSSSAAIAACGFLEMSKYLTGEEAEYYRKTAGRFLKTLTDHYQVKDPGRSNGQLLHGVYAKKTPYNTCKNNGVDECVIWGDYFFMEALTRLINRDWEMYW